MSTTTINNAAMVASEKTGISQDFLTALITEEGTLSKNGNPFNITIDWANMTGFPSIVVGKWNDVGVAIINDPIKAVDSWAVGINTWGAYKQFRTDAQNPSKSAYDLALDLYKTGYAGGDSAYPDKIAALYKAQTGKDGYAPMGNSTTADPLGLLGKTVPSTTTTTDTTTAVSVATPSPDTKHSGDNPNVLSFGQGIMHILAIIFLSFVAALLIIEGVQIVLATRTLAPAESIVKAANG